MNSFFLLVELLSYAFALFLILKKKELAIVYFPVMIFANNIIEPVVPASAFYLTISSLVVSFLLKNASFYKHNGFSLILVLYYIVLIPRSDDIVFIRPYLFGVLWLFILIPLITAVYRKYTREIIFGELSKSALIILVLFIANSLVSTLKGYSPHEMYGITSGILYGKVYAAGFNVLPFAAFIVSLKFLDDKKIKPFIILVIAFTFIILSFRRSVMGLTFLGVTMAYLTMLTREKAKTFFLIGAISIIVGFGIYATTDLADHFKERYELRKLDERELEEEKRFIEYELLYKDMFIYRDYSPIIGYELFNSWGNYGRGILDERSLHGDLTNIAHSSGLLGVFLYLMMVLTAFRNSLKSAVTRTDLLAILFCAIAFIVYTITGRYTEIASMTMLYLVLALPIASVEEIEHAAKVADEPNKEPEPHANLFNTTKSKPLEVSQ